MLVFRPLAVATFLSMRLRLRLGRLVCKRFRALAEFLIPVGLFSAEFLWRITLLGGLSPASWT